MSFRRKAPVSKSLQDEVTRSRKKAKIHKEESRWCEVSNSQMRESKSQKNQLNSGRVARHSELNVKSINRRQSWSTFKKVGVGALALLLVFLVAVTGVFAHYMSRFIGEVQSSPFEPSEVSIASDFDFQFDQTGYFNIALLGVTKREGRDDLGSRSNTVMVASLNHDTGEVRLVSVYRDTLLELEDGSLDLVAHSYAFGGSRATVAMLNRNLDLNIQHYVTVDFAALALTVNALGGVEIDIVHEELSHINGLGHQMILEGEFAPGANLELPPMMFEDGTQLLCGVQALAYTRIRMVGNNDFQRTERQREVIEQMAVQARDASFGTINEIVDIVFEYLATNFSVTEMLAHSRNVSRYHIGETTGFPFDLSMRDLERTGSTLIPTTLEANVIQLHEFLFGTTNFTPSPIVQNISANIANVTATTVDSAMDMSPEGLGFGEPSENDVFNEENTRRDYPLPGNEDGGVELPPEDVPWNPPEDGDLVPPEDGDLVPPEDGPEPPGDV